MEIQPGNLIFPKGREENKRKLSQSHNFTREVVSAVAGITGYSIGFPDTDHSFGRFSIELATTIQGDVVTVEVQYGLRDDGGYDDDFSGNINYTLFAELASATILASRRSDISILDIEINQATQFFKSGQHLDIATANPDNSIPLVAGKATGIRIYPDYDPTAGLAPIYSLTGEIEIQTTTGTASTTLLPTNTSVTPQRASVINRGLNDETLNFTIPGVYCYGSVILRAWVYDAANPAQTSEIFQKTILFHERAPLRIFGVGVHLTAASINKPPPSEIDFINSLELLYDTYPVGDVQITGYTQLPNADDDVNQKVDGLLDDLNDLRGDSTDQYYAVVPEITRGAARTGNGISYGDVNDLTDAPHEIGHALGRRHVACLEVTRCSDPPENTDDEYPQYGSYPSDSIGEYGFNPRTGEVYNPATNFDFMGYSTPYWVSPYTYSHLMEYFPPTDGTTMYLAYLMSNRSSVHSESKNNLKTPQLFLGLEITRARDVVLRPSFVFPAYTLRLTGWSTPFTLELQDIDGEVLVCRNLRITNPYATTDCYPIIIRNTIPYSEHAKKLVIWEGNERIFEKIISKPAEFEAFAEIIQESDRIVFSWTSPEDSDLWYLIQGYQHETDTWRGIAPRTNSNRLTLPIDSISYIHSGIFRVLASSGIGTEMAYVEVEQNKSEDKPIIKVTKMPNGLLRADAILPYNQVSTQIEITWHDQAGKKIGEGKVIREKLFEQYDQVHIVASFRGQIISEQIWSPGPSNNSDEHYSPKLME